MEIFRLSRKWPMEERFSLTDQIRRSSRSVCTNIAEGWRKRRYEAANVSKLSDSDGEAAETEVHLEFALSCGYLAAEAHAKLSDQYDHICRQLTKMMDDASSWCGTDSELREVPPEYLAEPGPTELERWKHDRVVEATASSLQNAACALHASDAQHAPPAPQAGHAPRSARS